MRPHDIILGMLIGIAVMVVGVKIGMKLQEKSNEGFTITTEEC